MKKFAALFILAIIATSCGSSTSQAKKDFNQLKKEVISEHDVMMKDVMQLSALIKKLKPQIDTTTQKGTAYKQASDRLKEAHDAMFTWMHTFHKAFPNISKENQTYTEEEYQKQLVKLKEQQKSLLTVKKSMEESIAHAQTLLANKN